jgi:hypothetical protein
MRAIQTWENGIFVGLSTMLLKKIDHQIRFWRLLNVRSPVLKRRANLIGEAVTERSSYSSDTQI